MILSPVSFLGVYPVRIHVILCKQLSGRYLWIVQEWVFENGQTFLLAIGL